jgi:FtsP/CotA-like multicopper oxidase with cupredoxin domain
MRISSRSARAALVAALVAAGLAVIPQQADAAVVTINLCAKPGTLSPLPTTSPATTIPIWGFGQPATPGACGAATATLPGPVVTATVGDSVTFNVTNGLTTPVRFEVPGIDFLPGPTDVPPGGTLVRTFTASKPGTFLYQSAGDSGRQEAMGLYGMLIVRPVTPGQAYGSTTAYDREAPLVLSAVDPAFNTAPLTADVHAYRATYWLINGRAYPDTAPVAASPGQRVLLRYANGGFDNTTMELLGTHQSVVARDAYPLATPTSAAAETIPAGATEDTIVTMPAAGTAPSAHGFPLFNRQLHVTNGPQTGPSPTPAGGGGMLTFLGP